MFDGLTGTALASETIYPTPPKTDSPTPEQMKDIWGDGHGNRGDRFLACVAYLDGERPSIVMCRGYYTRTMLAAWDLRDGKLTQPLALRQRLPERTSRTAARATTTSRVADVDEDGKDEIVYGGAVIDDDGKGLYSTGLGHGDAMHVCDLDPAQSRARDVRHPGALRRRRA